MVADDTFNGVFFAMLIWLPIVFLWVAVLVDIFRRHDLSGIAMAAWLLAIIVFPIIGALVYFAVRPAAAGADVAPAESMVHTMRPDAPH
jgi:hypothetical protein